MAIATTPQGVPYPDPGTGEANNVPVHMKALAEWVDGFVAGLPATYVRGAAATQDVMRKLAHGENVRIAIPGDSLNNEVTEFGGLLGTALGTAHLAYTVTWIPMLNETYASGPPVTLQIGPGANPPTLQILNMSLAGAQSYNTQSADFLNALTTFDPHLILVAFGHNDGEFTGDPQVLGRPREAFRLRYQLMLEEFRRRLPHAPIVLVAQQPWADGLGDMAAKRDEFRLLAQLGGHGFVDVYQAWKDAAGSNGWYLDNVHVNATGEAFYRDTILPIFTLSPRWEPRPAPPSLLDAATPMNLADEMVMPLGATIPIGWTADNATATRDTNNFESARGYAVKVVPVSGAASSRLFRQQLDAAEILPWRGKWLTVLVRMRRPAAGGVDNRFVGRVSVTDGVAVSKTFEDNKGYGGFMWRAVPHLVDAAAVGLTVNLWTDNATGALNPEVTWDRLMIVPGLRPFGWAGSPGNAPMRTAAKYERVTVGDPTATTTPTLVVDAAVNVIRDILIRAGGLARWILRTQTNETGADVGSDLFLLSRTDAGGALNTVVTFNRKRGNVDFGMWVKCGRYTTAARPNAVTAGQGSQIFDTTLNRPIWSDGATWRDSAGGVV